jgi:hypothetical protein
MNDRELLEMAAKAAGVSGRFIEETPEDGYPRYRCFIGKIGALTTRWNPLTDDGDALRLAAKLKMMVNFAGVPHAYAEMPICDFVTDACYRRAIVRAAAAFGQAMK